MALCLLASTALFAQTTQVIAHRGFHATKNSVRNSLSALQNAQDFGAFGSECDINETADGVLVVVHGPMHGEYEVQKTDYATLRAKALENAQKQIDSAFEQACVDKAAELATVELPAGLIDMELDNQMERFAYQLQMSGYSMEQYAKMMGGDVSTMRNAFRPAAEKQAKIDVTLAKIVEVEGITVSEEDMNEEFEALAKQYELEVEKVKSMVPAEEIKTSLETRKAVKVLVENAVPVAPKAKEETEE